MTEITDDYLTVLRLDFVNFVIRCMPDIDPASRYLHNWHVEMIASALENSRIGKCNRLIINLPPRHLKSMLASVFFPAWLLGNNPATKIICISCGQDLTEKHARDFRKIVTSEWYKALFPDMRLEKEAVQEISTTKNGFRYCASVHGPLIGRGADFIIIDDPIKPDEALSETQRHGVNGWFASNAFTRLDNKATGRIIVVMQRLHEEDLSGHLIAQGGWEAISFPAIAEVNETHEIFTPFGRRCFERRAGEALHPERESLAILNHIRKTMGEYHFASQYQQNPMPAEGNMVKLAWFRYYDFDKAPNFSRIVQSWDTASKAGRTHDYSVCTTWGVTEEKHYYLLNVFRRQLEFPDLKRDIRAMQERYAADVVVIEDAGSGIQLIQQLRSEGMGCIHAYKTKSIEKEFRLYTQTAAIEGGFVHLPKEASWLPDYIKELTSFPSGKYDDQVDSTSQFLDYISKPEIGDTGLQLLKMQLERQNAMR